MDIMYFWWANSWKLTKPMMLDQPKRKWLKWYRTSWIGKHKTQRSTQARTSPYGSRRQWLAYPPSSPNGATAPSGPEPLSRLHDHT